MLDETKYFKIINQLIPEEVTRIYRQGPVLRELKNRLDDITVKYNYIQENLEFVERPLFYKQLQGIEESLVQGICSLTWESSKEEIDAFINRVKQPVDVLNAQVKALRDSLRAIEELLKQWAGQPMVEKPPKSALVQDKVIPAIQNKCQQFKRDNLTKIKQRMGGSGSPEVEWEIDVDKVTVNISRAKNIVFL